MEEDIQQKKEQFSNSNNKKNELDKNKNLKLLVIVFVILFLGFLGFWYWTFKISNTTFEKSVPSASKIEKKKIEKEDSLSFINEELEKIEILDLEQEFKSIDEDLNYL